MAPVKPVLTGFSKPNVCAYLGRVRLYDCYDARSGATVRRPARGSGATRLNGPGGPNTRPATSDDCGPAGPAQRVRPSGSGPAGPAQRVQPSGSGPAGPAQ